MYEFANKPNKYLANLLRSRSQAQVISSIKDKEGKCHHDNKVINKIFRAFYKRLYSSQSGFFSGDNMDKFLANLNLRESTEEQRQMLNKPIGISEILNCINSLPKGKAPGPDGFTVEFFQKFKMELGSLMHEMIQYSFDSDRLPDSMTEANICVFLKKGKCPEECGSYRPISLLNVDTKIVAKILATRLESILPKIIDPDQTGFVKGRSSAHNIRRLFNIIQYSNQYANSGLVISLDAEKAFDRVE